MASYFARICRSGKSRHGCRDRARRDHLIMTYDKVSSVDNLGRLPCPKRIFGQQRGGTTDQEDQFFNSADCNNGFCRCFDRMHVGLTNHPDRPRCRAVIRWFAQNRQQPGRYGMGQVRFRYLRLYEDLAGRCRNRVPTGSVQGPIVHSPLAGCTVIH